MNNSKKHFQPSKAPQNWLATDDVIAIDKIKFVGDLVCSAWLHNIRNSRGFADTVAVLVLSRIIYWYRGTNPLKEKGENMHRRKFAGDLLQKSYADLSAELNLTKVEVTNAIKRLEKKNILKRVFRTIMCRGIKCANVLFIQIFPKQIAAVSVISEEPRQNKDDNQHEAYPSEKRDMSSAPASVILPEDESTHIAGGDKYTENDIDYSKDYDKEAEEGASSSVHPGNPAAFSDNPSNTKTEEAGKAAFRTHSSQVQINLNPARDSGCPDHTPGNGTSAQDDLFAKILNGLVRAFQGQQFTSPGRAKLKQLVEDGWITLEWVEAFELVKPHFDCNRGHFKAKSIYLPYTPKHLLDNIDKSRIGILSLLSEMYAPFAKEEQSGFDQDELRSASKGMNRLAECARKDGVQDREYTERLKGMGMLNHAISWLLNPQSRDRTDLPPAWLRLLYSFTNSLYFEECRSALLEKAQTELGADPRWLKAEGVNLSDDDIQKIFGIDYIQAFDSWERKDLNRGERMNKLERLIIAVSETEYAQQRDAID